MKGAIILLMVVLIVCQLFVSTNGKKSKIKSSDQQKLLKEITTDIEKCVKKDKNIDKKELTKFNKCLVGFKKQKNTLDQKNKSTKSTLKKVAKDIIKCLKPKETKNTKKCKDKKGTKNSKKCKDKKGKLPKQKRQKRSGRAPGKRPASENIDELLDTVQECESNM